MGKKHIPTTFAERRGQVDENEDTDEDDDGGAKAKKDKLNLAAILSKAPQSFPWLFPTPTEKKRTEQNAAKQREEPEKDNDSSLETGSANGKGKLDEILEKSVGGSGFGFKTAQSASSLTNSSSAGQPKLSWLFPPRNQQINIRLKQQKAEEEKRKKKGKEENRAEEEEVRIELEEEKRTEKEEEKEGDRAMAMEAKALLGGTLWQRATSVVSKKQSEGAEGEQQQKPSSLLPQQPSLLSLSIGAAQLGIVTPALRAAAVSDWRRKSEQELRRKCKNNPTMRRMLGSPRQDGDSEMEIEEGKEGRTESEEGIALEEEFFGGEEKLANGNSSIPSEEEKADGSPKKKKKRKTKEKQKTGKKDRKRKRHREEEENNENKELGEGKGEGKKRKEKRPKKDKSEKKKDEAEEEIRKRIAKRMKKRRKEEKELAKKGKRRKKARAVEEDRRTLSRTTYSRSRSRTRSPSSRRSRHPHPRPAHSSRSRTYSSSRSRSPICRRSRSRTPPPSPLPPFSRRRAFETRRRLIEESWHRRIEHSIRPYNEAGDRERSGRSPQRKSPIGNLPLDKADYVDEQGRMDKQKLLEIATKNATKLAMEGKLPKGLELTNTIKNKSVDQLVDLCKQLQRETDLLPKGSSSDEDEDGHYSKRYDRWREDRDRDKNREFSNRGVRDAPERSKYKEKEERHRLRKEDDGLRLTFPVSSGVQHRTKTGHEQPRSELSAGPLARIGEIGPLTSALAKVRTNLTAVYKPLSIPLPNAQPSSVLTANFQSIPPAPPPMEQKPPSPRPLSPPKLSPPDLVSSSAYQIALAAAARTTEIEKEKTKEPILATSSGFVGPVQPQPAVTAVLAAAMALSAENRQQETKITIPQPGTIESATPCPPLAVPTIATQAPAFSTTFSPFSSAHQQQQPIAVQISQQMPVFSSSWDKPGHIAAREAFLKKIAEQKRQAEETAAAKAKLEKEQMEKVLAEEAAVAKAKAELLEKKEREKAQTLLINQMAQGKADQSQPAASSATNDAKIVHEAASIIPAKQPTGSGPLATAPTARTKTAEIGFIEYAERKNSVPTTVDVLVSKTEKNLPFTSQTMIPSTLPLTKASSSTPPPLVLDKQMPSTSSAVEKEEENPKDLMDRMQAYVDAQVARQKAESFLHATILSAHLHKKQIPADSSELASSFASNSSFHVPAPVFRQDPIGRTKPEKTIQELVAERIRYSQRLQRDPNDYESRRALARIEEEMSKWAENSALPGEFTGHTGARVLSEKELEPNDPRFHSWARKDQFRNAPELSAGVGMRLLQKMGWKPGQGLGRENAGPIEPLALDVKADRKGFYSEDYERVPKRESILDPTGKNPISVLMEVCTRNRWNFPDFNCDETGPMNNRRYHWKAVLNGVEYSPSLPSSNKKAGKAQVCMVILEALGMTA